MTNQNNVVELLREKASTDPVSSAVLHMWALRKRARHEVTLDGLAARMKAEGFIHDKRQYEPILKFIANLGLGRLQVDAKGHVIALKEIKTTLQSIGRAACDVRAADDALKIYRKKTRFRNLAVHRVSDDKQPEAKEAPTVSQQAPVGTMSLVLSANGQPITVPIDPNLPDEEFLYLAKCLKKAFLSPSK